MFTGIIIHCLIAHIAWHNIIHPYYSLSIYSIFNRTKMLKTIAKLA